MRSEELRAESRLENNQECNREIGNLNSIVFSMLGGEKRG